VSFNSSELTHAQHCSLYMQYIVTEIQSVCQSTTLIGINPKI